LTSAKGRPLTLAAAATGCPPPPNSRAIHPTSMSGRRLDDLHAIVHRDGHDDGVDPLQFGQHVHDLGGLSPAAIERARRDEDLSPFQVVHFAVFEQIVEQGDGIGIERAAQSVRHHIEIGAARDEPGARFQIPAGGRCKGERAGFLIESQRHHRRFERRHAEAPPAELFDQEGRRGADGFDDRVGGTSGAGRGLVDVMIEYDDFDGGILQAVLERADPLGLLRIDEDQSRDPGEIEVFQLAEAEIMGGEKLANSLLRAGRQHELRLGKQLARGDHGGQPVEIGMAVRGDHIHARILAGSAEAGNAVHVDPPS
jgi:hypothetical protein